MTDDEIIARAKSLGWNVEHAQTNRMLILFARDVEDQVRHQEREACAKTCDPQKGFKYDKLALNVRQALANEIRARGQA